VVIVDCCWYCNRNARLAHRLRCASSCALQTVSLQFFYNYVTFISCLFLSLMLCWFYGLTLCSHSTSTAVLWITWHLWCAIYFTFLATWKLVVKWHWPWFNMHPNGCIGPVAMYCSPNWPLTAIFPGLNYCFFSGMQFDAPRGCQTFSFHKICNLWVLISFPVIILSVKLQLHFLNSL